MRARRRAVAIAVTVASRALGAGDAAPAEQGPPDSVPAGAVSPTLASRREPPTPDPRSGPARAWTTRVGGFIQADAILSNQSSVDQIDNSGTPLNQTRFLIRRARVRLDVEHRFVWGSVELDANTVDGIRGGLTEADVGATWSGDVAREPAAACATLGMFRIPFGMEVPQRDPDRFFLERTTMSRALFPGSIDLGARAEASFGPLRAVVAVMNGNPISDRFLPARDPNSEKDVIGRLGVETDLAASVRLRLGFSALTGTGLHPGTPSTKDVLVWRDTNENGRVETTEIQVIAGSAATPSQNFDRFALGSDLRLTVDVPLLGALELTGELLWAKNLDRGIEPADPVSLGRDVRESGYYVGLTQELTRHAMIGVRYDRYNPDADGAEQRGVALIPRDAAYSTWAVAVAARFAPARLILEYDANQNALGRNSAGTPTNLASNQLAVRGEVVF
jgi:hypothetical protein